MAYTPTVWKDGDIVTSAKLNKMENGIVTAEGSGGGTFVVTATYDEETDVRTLNATWQEIYDAMESGKTVIILEDGSDSDPPYINRSLVIGCRIYPDTGVYSIFISTTGFYAQSSTEPMTDQMTG